jgi:hypothetical protein
MAVVMLDHSTHTYTVDGMRVRHHVSGVLEAAGIVKPFPPEARANVERAALRGTCFHAWAKWLDEDPEDIDGIEALDGTDVLPFMVALQKFRVEHHPDWEAIEKSFERDNVAGTPDRIGTMKVSGERVPVILDFKTSRAVQPYWPIQLTAYMWLTEYVDCDLYVVHLKPNATYELLAYEPNPEVWEAALTIAKWQIS